jgi:predicted MFS family arabinose efflux permease
MATRCSYDDGMFGALARLNPFKTAEGRRLALLFAVVYFAQGMWYLPNQTITIIFKDAGYNVGSVANFFVIAGTPWLIKPLYGLLSDFFPIFGRRRVSYLVMTSSRAAAGGFLAAAIGSTEYRTLLVLFTVMGFGLAFTDVLADAVMVERGRQHGLTGAFQSVQWAAIYTSSMLVGLIGGWMAQRRNLVAAFFLAGCFPVITLIMTAAFVREKPAHRDRAALVQRLAAVRGALRAREVWLVAGFIFFFTFSPSFGPGFLYYQTDQLGFSQEFIGALNALQSFGSVLGALTYGPLSRRWPLRRTINVSIGLSAAWTLIYLLYRGPWSGAMIDFTYGWVYMVTTLSLLDLAARVCPTHIEGAFFALLMSVYNAGIQGSQWTGGHLYDSVGFERLVLISTAATLLTYILVPFVHVDRIEAASSAAADAAVAAHEAAHHRPGHQHSASPDFDDSASGSDSGSGSRN